MSTSFTVADNILSEDLIKEIKKIGFSSDQLKTNLTHWNESVVGGSGTILLYEVKDLELLEKIKTPIEKAFNIVDSSSFKWSVNYTLFSRLSYIPWHNDYGHAKAITIYLNEFWDKDWGGALILSDVETEIDNVPNGKMHAVYPSYNKGVCITSPLFHTVTMPTIFAPLRETLQIFLDNPKAPKEEQSE